MKKIDLKSVIIGCLLTIIFFLAVGAKDNNGRFDKITANHIVVTDKLEIESDTSGVYINPGGISLLNNKKEGIIRIFPEGIQCLGLKGSAIISPNIISLMSDSNRPTIVLGKHDSNNGYIDIYQPTGNNSISLMTSKDGGIIKTYSDNIARTILGSDKAGDGILTVRDKKNNITSISSKQIISFNNQGQTTYQSGMKD